MLLLLLRDASWLSDSSCRTFMWGGMGEGWGGIGWVVAFNLSEGEAVSAPASSGRIMAELLIMPYFLPLPLPLPLPYCMHGVLGNWRRARHAMHCKVPCTVTKMMMMMMRTMRRRTMMMIEVTDNDDDGGWWWSDYANGRTWPGHSECALSAAKSQFVLWTPLPHRTSARV